MKASSSGTSTSITCPVCNKFMRVITTQHIRLHGYPDATSFKAAFNLDSLKCDAVRAKQSQFMAENNPTSGGHRPESIQKMRENRAGKGIGRAGKYERTPEIRNKIARGVLAAWEKGKRGRGKYIYGRKAGRKVWVRSSWEERVVALLDAHPCVEGYEVEPFQIPYQWEGRTRQYTPDFLVHLEGGIQELWEIKPSRFTGHPCNLAKLAALNGYVQEHGMNARLVVLAHIEGMEHTLTEGWVRPDDPDYRPTLAEIRAVGGSEDPFCP